MAQYVAMRYLSMNTKDQTSLKYITSKLSSTPTKKLLLRESVFSRIEFTWFNIEGNLEHTLHLV